MSMQRVDASDVDVVVGIVTHRRPASLSLVLERLAALDFDGRPVPRVAVVVVDNSPDFEGRPVVESARVSGHLPIDYIPVGAGNISIGRNAVLAAACGRAPLVALIDDDEVPEPEWLHHLLDALERTSADVVVGPVVADYPDDAPAWLRRPVFHSLTGPSAGDWVDEAYTCNVLFRSNLVNRLGLEFDESLGLSGGEDQLFFRQAREGGARIWFEPAAVVHDAVALERLSVRYLLRREFRMGNTLGLLDRSRPGWPAGRPWLRVMRAAWWAVTGVTAIGRSAITGDRAGAVVGLMRVVRATGMPYGLLGRTYELYAAPGNRRTKPPVLAIVAAEGPGYQRAGHSRHLEGFVAHFQKEGYDVVLVIPGQRTGFLVRRNEDGVSYDAPSLRTICGWQLLTAPAAVAAHLAWSVFRHLPLVAQRVVDRFRNARRARQQVDHVLGTWLTQESSTWVGRSLQRIQPDAVMFNTVFLVPDSLVLPSSVRVSGVISHDVVHERADSFRKAGHRVQPADFSLTDEAARLAAVDTVIAIQWDDAQALARIAPHAEVVVSPVVVEADSASRDQAVPGRCLFVGSGSLHNVEALTWFLKECWPDIVTRQPGSELHVVGTVCARVQASQTGVVFRGEVDELVQEYRQAQVVIAPLRTGSGLKVKVVEALCHGIATVTTSVGAQGLGGLRPSPYVLADTASAFIDEVVALLTDGAARRRLESAAMTAAPLFSAERAYEELDERLKKIGVSSPRACEGALA